MGVVITCVCILQDSAPNCRQVLVIEACTQISLESQVVSHPVSACHDALNGNSNCRDVGAVSATSFHLVLRCNGEFYGLFAYTENDDKYYLEVRLPIGSTDTPFKSSQRNLCLD